jgi:hypothetical protein
MASTLEDKENAKDAWDAIVVVRIGRDHIHMDTQQKLWLELYHLVFRPREDVNDFALCLFGLVQ